MRRAVVVLALVFVLALGVVFSAWNVGIAQQVNPQTATCKGTLKWLPQPPYLDPSTQDPNDWLPREDGMYPPTQIRDRRVCDIDGTNKPNKITGTDNVNMVDKIEGKGGGDTLTGGRGWNGLIGDPGKDTIQGGPDTDIVFAEDEVKQKTTGENAQVELNGNPEQDTITCGKGTDTVYADEIDKVAADCERVEQKVEPDEPDIPVAHWYRRLVRGK
jgi:RTX calcium-binding nonapeptide repeat (4 copies)